MGFASSRGHIAPRRSGVRVPLAPFLKTPAYRRFLGFCVRDALSRTHGSRSRGYQTGTCPLSGSLDRLLGGQPWGVLQLVNDVPIAGQRQPRVVAELARNLDHAAPLVQQQRGEAVARRGHDPGRVVRDLAVMLVDGGECVSDLGVVREQVALFGVVASDSTAFRMVDRVASEPGLLDALRVAHAQARARFGSCMVRLGG